MLDFTFHFTLIFFSRQNRFKAVEPVIGAVKKICSALDGVETPAITEAVNKLKRTVKLPGNKSPEVVNYIL